MKADIELQETQIAKWTAKWITTVPLADEMYLSTIKGDFEGDTYFPEFDAADWEVTEQRCYRRFGRRANPLQGG